MHMAPPERIAAVVTIAASALDVKVVPYLVDYDQADLHAVLEPGAPPRPPLGIDTTLAGRAFRGLDIVHSVTDGKARLWLPLIDGVERLGVLEIVLPDPSALEDNVLRSQLTWLSALIGHLFTISTEYGDGLDHVRRTRPRNPSAELVWQLLPPLTAGTNKVVVAGVVAPADTIGGDAFDYSLSETTAHLAIFDATGHSLDSGLVTAMALSAYRSARRNGRSLFDQAHAIDEVIGEDFARTGQMITAVVAELDLDSGKLRYIDAGHPYPLVVRGGKVVKSLTAGHRKPFGLPVGELTVGEEMLEPGDWLVFYTDGITEARDHEGAFFGLDRFQDLLAREIAAGHPPPEMVRRLTRDVLEHQRGVLQDDATVLVARWGDYRLELTP
jgi:hypothetical protein